MLIINLLFPCYELGRVEADSKQVLQLFLAEVYVSLGVWPSTPAPHNLLMLHIRTHIIFASSEWHNGAEKLCRVKWSDYANML